jgi:two-component system, OmpR family, alkaline phosphatase synthesis response regulator PhoP
VPGESVLVVDDEASIVQLARLYLEREGYTVSEERDGAAALERIRTEKPSLVVLDIMLPGMNGLDVCRAVRAENLLPAVIMLTARDEDIDKIIGLEIGADDYMTKPFNPRELVARVKAILRRTTDRPSINGAVVLRIGDLVIDAAAREVHCRGKELDLRTQEFEVLVVFARNRGTVLSREQLLNQAWGFDFYGQTRTVDVHIAQLRRKLEPSTVKIETVTGVGYKLVA